MMSYAGWISSKNALICLLYLAAYSLYRRLGNYFKLRLAAARYIKLPAMLGTKIKTELDVRKHKVSERPSACSSEDEETVGY